MNFILPIIAWLHAHNYKWRLGKYRGANQQFQCQNCRANLKKRGQWISKHKHGLAQPKWKIEKKVHFMFDVCMFDREDLKRNKLHNAPFRGKLQEWGKKHWECLELQNIRRVVMKSMTDTLFYASNLSLWKMKTRQQLEQKRIWTIGRW